MARGFGATKGSTTSDLITTPYSGEPAGSLRSASCWVNRNGAGGNSFGTVFGKVFSGTNLFRLSFDATNTAWSVGVPFSTTTGNWRFPGGTGTGTWNSIIFTMDATSSANNPVGYVNNVSQTVTRATAPSGTFATSSNFYTIGNRSDQTRNLDGIVAEVGIWGRILGSDEIAALAKGMSPLFFLNGLVMYVPLLGKDLDLLNGVNTVVGTANQDHPTIFYPDNPRVFSFKGSQTFTETPSDTASVTDGASLQMQYLRSLGDSSSVADSIVDVLNRLISVSSSDSISLTDSLTFLLNRLLKASGSDSISISETETNQLYRLFSISASDSVSTTDLVTILLQRLLLLSLSDSLSVSDALVTAKFSAGIISISDVISVLDSAAPSAEYGRTIQDTASTTDAVIQSLELLLALHDAVTVSDNAAILLQLGHLINLVLSDTISVATALQLAGSYNFRLHDSSSVIDTLQSLLLSPSREKVIPGEHAIRIHITGKNRPRIMGSRKK